MGDDGCNVHGTYAMVYATPAADEVVLRGWTSAFSIAGPTPDDLSAPKGQFLVGDIIEFSEPQRRHAPGFSAQVVELLPDVVVTTTDNRTERLKRVRLDQDLPEDVEEGTFVANTSELASFLMVNSTIRRNRGQGLRVQTRDALIENCHFEDIQGNAVWLNCDVDVGHESIATRNTTVRDCTFIRSVRAITSSAGRVGPVDPDIHEGLTVEGCTVEGCGAFPLKLYSIKGATIRENTFTISGSTPLETGASSDIVMEGNTILAP